MEIKYNKTSVLCRCTCKAKQSFKYPVKDEDLLAFMAEHGKHA